MPDPGPQRELAARLRRSVAQSIDTARLMGADSVPVFRSATPAAPAETPRPEPGPASPDTPPAAQFEAKPSPKPRSEPVAAAGDTSRARAQADLDEIRARYEADAPHEAFVTSFTHIVFGEGDPCASLMFIGEAPGADEDRTGRPFVGRAGQLLDKMITAMGLRREQVYIANVLKTRPPNNATPTTEEARACAPYLFEQIRVVRPRVIVTLGLPATRLVLDTTESMGRLRARWGRLELPDSERYPGVSVDVMPTYHPAYLLRSYTAENRGKVWSDLQQAMARLADD